MTVTDDCDWWLWLMTVTDDCDWWLWLMIFYHNIWCPSSAYVWCCNAVHFVLFSWILKRKAVRNRSRDISNIQTSSRIFVDENSDVEHESLPLRKKVTYVTAVATTQNTQFRPIRVPISIVGKGAVLGESVLLGRTRFSESAVCVCKTDAIRIRVMCVGFYYDC
jgi:hypothetical protein